MEPGGLMLGGDVVPTLSHQRCCHMLECWYFSVAADGNHDVT